MSRTGASTLSDLLSGVALHGRTWCYSDLIGSAGFTVAPGDAVLFHAVLHGAARVACAGGEVAELARGDMVFVLSGEAHALRTDAASPAGAHEVLRGERAADVPPTIALGGSGAVACRVLSGRLRATWPEATSRADLPALLELRAGSPAAALLRPDAVALAGLGPGSTALLTGLAQALLIAALRADPRCRQILAPVRRDPIGDALRLIRADPSASWTVEKLARAVGMGRSNFAAHFSQEVGRAPMEVVAERRMEHAAGMLRQGRLKIAEISEMAGYNSEAAFSRRFTRHFGVSPSLMRERAAAERHAAPAEPDRFRKLLAAPLAPEAASTARQPAAARKLDGASALGRHFRLAPRD